MLVLAMVVAPVLLLLGRVLLTDENFAFRDASHYYYGQFEWEQRQWRAGRIPLWNPQENLGSSVIADPTSSLFYPGKLVFWLPLAFDTRYKLYLVVHALGAAWAAYALARTWQCSRAASVLCGLSYACSGNVLFLYTNAVFLVGAAWLPVALAALEKIIQCPRWPFAVGLGAVLAMMILGGDPQLAVHTVMIGLLRVFFLGRGTSSPLPCPAASAATGLRWRLTGLLAIAMLVSLALSAIQALPVIAAAPRSFRAAYDSPRSVWELIARGSPDKQSLAGLVGPPPNDAHHGQLYDFSVGPWRLVELVWPNVLGKMFPTHRRWGSAIPAEARVWTPSLYQGLVPLLLAIVGTLGWRDARQRWLTWTAVLAILAGCGSYGLGWLVREICGDLSIPSPKWLGDPTGGIYWLLVTLVPNYVQFRYPAKWWVVAALAIAGLAARGLDRVTRQADNDATDATPDVARERVRRQLRGMSLGVAVVSGGLLMALPAIKWSGRWDAWLVPIPSDPWLGPLDTNGALWDCMLALATALGISFVTWVLVRSAKLRSSMEWVLVGVTFVDLVLAQHWLVATAPGEYFRGGRHVSALLGQSRLVHRGGLVDLPHSWRNQGSPDRLAETVRWDAATYYAKFGLLIDAGTVDSPLAAETADYAAVLEALATEARRKVDERDADRWRSLVTDLLHVDWQVDTSVAQPDGRWRHADELFRPLDEDSLARRAWVVRDIEYLPPLAESNLDSLRRGTSEVLFPIGRQRNWNETAVVEMAERFDLTEANPLQLAADRHMRIRNESAQQVELSVSLRTPALLVMADRYDPDWTVAYGGFDTRTRRGQPTWANGSIVPVNRVCRGVWLPTGEYSVVFRYRPTWFYRGALVSAVSGLGIVLGAVRCLKSVSETPQRPISRNTGRGEQVN